MQIFCTVGGCGAFARHSVTSQRLFGRRTFWSCTYHVSGVYVSVCDTYGGKVTVCTSFDVNHAPIYARIGSNRRWHELAG